MKTRGTGERQESQAPPIRFTTPNILVLLTSTPHAATPQGLRERRVSLPRCWGMGGGRRLGSRTDLKKSANVLNRCNVQKKKKKKKNRKRADSLDLPLHRSAATITETCANFSHGFPDHSPQINTKTVIGHRPASTRLKADS